MSGKARELFGAKGLLDEAPEDDGTYRPWVTGSSYAGDMPKKLKIVPARHASPHVWRIPYLQVIVQKLDRDTGQLCLMFPGSDMTVFIDGRGLEELDELIEERKVKSIHMFDEAVHQPIGNDAPIITKIEVEHDTVS